MKRLTTRVEDLERRAPDAIRRVHRVIQDIGMSRDEALDAYGREKIGKNDGVILRVIVDAKS